MRPVDPLAKNARFLLEASVIEIAMIEEVLAANPPLTPEEQAVVTTLSETDLQAIDAIIFGHCSERWLKVARVVTRTADTLEKRYAGLSYVFYAQRLCQVIKEGRLESRGNVLYMRFSEVRLPGRSNSSDNSSGDSAR